MKKKCHKCGHTKDESEFHKNSAQPDGLQSQCKMCKKETDAEAYENSESIRQSIRDSAKKLKERNRAWVANYLKSHPCVDCGETDIRVLEFDHVRGNKKNNISTLIRGSYGLETVKEEVSKCDVRCRNCHSIRHQEENDSWILEYVEDNHS